MLKGVGMSDNKFNISVEQMGEAGMHFGHRISKRHPGMIPFIYGTRNTIHLIDLEKTAEKLNEALEFISKLGQEKKTILLVGTRIQVREITKKFAEDCNFFYVNSRWLGGTFTNFETIKKRLEYFRELKRKRDEGELEKYTKKERLDMTREIEKLEVRFGGIEKMTKLPDAIIVLSACENMSTIKEAQEKNIPVVAVTDTDANPKGIDYIIPANDDAVLSLQYILEKIKKAYA
jgi:small subunit ribosomal protein S2